MKRTLKLFAPFLLAVCGTAFADDTAPAAVEWETWPDTWVAVDELGREVASSDAGIDRTEVDPNTTIGMFYYLWHGFHSDSGKDISLLLKEDPYNPAWGAAGSMHWGSKPWLGYYKGGDPYIVSKHIQMLVDAGVDFLFFDCTNAQIYQNAVNTVIAELERRDQLGMKYPRLAFLIHSMQPGTMTQIYIKFYRNKPQNEKYWFFWDGKPLALADVNELSSTSAALRETFTFRNSWAWRQQKFNLANEWSWLESYPQNPGWANKYDPLTSTNRRTNEQISVSVAQHPTTKIGKSYHNGKQPAVDKYGMCAETPQGLYFQEQWNRAIQVHPPVVMVSQFNEWCAQAQTLTSGNLGDCRPGVPAVAGDTYFVDVYSPEFSRDLEPSSHPSVRDNYYLQMVSNARKYRGATNIPVPTRSLTIDINGPFDQWDDETVEYRDDRGDTEFTSEAVQTPSTLLRPTNDIVRAKVTKNAETLFFYVETMADLTPFETSDLWMRLLINADCDYSNGWNGYDYMVYKDAATGRYSLMRNAEAGKFKWETVEAVDFRTEGNKLHLAIPRESIGHAGVEKDVDFKWADNIADDEPDILSFISDGDVAPNSRFNYRYKGSKLPGVGALDNVVAGRAGAAPVITAVNGGVKVDATPVAEGELVVNLFDTLGRRLTSARVAAGSSTTLAAPAGICIAAWKSAAGNGDSVRVVVR